MPIVTVEWIEGRSAEQKQALAAQITAAVADIGGANHADVWVVFHDVKPGDWAVGGRLAQQP